jgi:hypothetical protein
VSRRSVTALATVAAIVAVFAILLPRGGESAVGAAAKASGQAGGSGPGPSIPPQPPEPPTAATGPPFALSSFWNAPLAPDARLHPGSAKLTNELRRQVRKYMPWINTTEHSTPVYTVPAKQRRMRVFLDTPSALYTDAPGADLVRSRLRSVPLPPSARGAPGVNRHIVVWQPSSDTMWELWNAHRPERDGCPWGHEQIGGWHAAWGARIRNASQRDGINPFPTGATASGLALIGGLIRLDEWRSGQIDHALAMAIPDIQRDKVVWPATRTDGRYGGLNAIPMGTRLRLDPSLDVESLWISPAGKAIARAAQRYGIVIRDHADDAVTFYGEDPQPTGQDPYPEIFRGQSPNAVLRGFPWDRLQVLAVP